jgi:predicted house-cleaning noncanonical NTP pyrophosphatase (MazG superfamily)
MGKTTYGKLVRDKIPLIIESNGDTCITRVLPEDQYIDALQEKLKEETIELVNAGQEERLGELSDLLEVVFALAEADGYSISDLMIAADNKRSSRGGFSERLWLESTQSPS